MKAGIMWIGGISAAIVLALIGFILAGRMIESPGPAAQQEQAAQAASTEATTPPTPMAQAESAAAAAPDPAPAQAVPLAAGFSDPLVIKRILPITGPIKYGEWHWDDADVGPGPLVMTVDLEARVISVFRDGYEIGAAAVLLGTQDHPTPLGAFPILTRERHNVSEKYGNAPMPYTLRLTWDGVAIHGSDVENGYASHGCVGVPNAFAAKLFAIAQKGDKVIITRGKKADVGTSLAS